MCVLCVLSDAADRLFKVYLRLIHTSALLADATHVFAQQPATTPPPSNATSSFTLYGKDTTQDACCHTRALSRLDCLRTNQRRGQESHACRRRFATPHTDRSLFQAFLRKAAATSMHACAKPLQKFGWYSMESNSIQGHSTSFDMHACLRYIVVGAASKYAWACTSTD